MEEKYTLSQARVSGQKQNKKAKGNSKVQNETGKAIQKSKMDDGENEKQASSQYPKSIDCKLNGELQKAEPDFKMNPNIKASILAETEIRTKNLSENKYKDKKQKPLADKSPTEQATAVISNGVKPKPSDSFTNEHRDREPDKDSSGSEEGYIIPKKRKAKYNMTRSKENFNLMGFKMVTPAPRVPNLQQSFENPKLYSNGQSDIKVVGPKSVWNSERWAVGAGRGKPGPGHMQEKAFDTKPDLNNSKVDPGPKIVPTAPVVPKEEAWSLFNQPTIFSINNSNVPKVTYASKVKQNLYRVQSPPICLESCSESELSPESIAALSLSSAITGSSSHWLTQSPMSALKPANSLDFANGPEKSMKADSNQVLPLEDHLIRRPSSSPKSVIHKVNPNCPPVEPSLFTWSSNVPAALTGLMPNIMPPQTQTQMLKKIFQNEWGLSFITEPSISPEIAQGIAPDPEVIQSPPPHEYPNSLASQETSESPCVPEYVLFPEVYNWSKWLGPPAFGDIIKPPVPIGESKALMLESIFRDDHLQQANPKNHKAFTVLPNNYKMDNTEPLPISTLPDSTLEDSEQKNARESFDARAAVEYHMTEIKSILDRQKQDPKRVITYDESMDHSAP